VKELGSYIAEDSAVIPVGKKNSSAPSSSEGTEFDMNTEVNLLHKMPGYEKLQKKIFKNLMSAIPDDNESNLRHPLFRAGGDGDRSDDAGGVSRVSMSQRRQINTNNTDSSHESSRTGHKKGAGIQPLDDCLTRAMVKDISALIVEKNAHKIRLLDIAEEERLMKIRVLKKK
jgi:hypothetical protein